MKQKFGAVAQLARAVRSQRTGHGFDPHRLHHYFLKRSL